MKYHKERDAKTLKKLEQEKAKLPNFCNRFFLGISQTTAPLTRLAYATDLRLFFDFLTVEIDVFIGKKISELNVKDLLLVEVFHIELFADYLSRYEKDGKILCNGAQAKQRKLSSLRSFFAYLYKKGEISTNIMPNIDLPKVLAKPIIRLDDNEVEEVLDVIEDDELYTKGQRRFRQATELRDKTIWLFFLASGLRVSELVGLNVGDIDLEKNSFKVTRKGGAETILFISEELHDGLKIYFAKYGTADENEPLFKSIQRKRISIRQVENIIHKYATKAVPLKNITPHKLRSTFGTNLYRATGDIYAVADVLGHLDVNTTKKHYAATSEDTRREVTNKIRIRKSKDEIDAPDN